MKTTSASEKSKQHKIQKPAGNPPAILNKLPLPAHSHEFKGNSSK
jgi:hypothetical protein